MLHEGRDLHHRRAPPRWVQTIRPLVWLEIMTRCETVIRDGAAPMASCASALPLTRRSARVPTCSISPALAQTCLKTGDIEHENFNAAVATVTIHGFSVHPGSAKDTAITLPTLP
ncbi:MAG: hypothetical protein ACLVJH_12060 [Faecalibacterium prausnitzii]